MALQQLSQDDLQDLPAQGSKQLYSAPLYLLYLCCRSQHRWVSNLPCRWVGSGQIFGTPSLPLLAITAELVQQGKSPMSCKDLACPQEQGGARHRIVVF